MELFGSSLEDIFEGTPAHKFSLKTTCMLGIQMIKVLKYIHDKHIQLLRMNYAKIYLKNLNSMLITQGNWSMSKSLIMIF